MRVLVATPTATAGGAETLLLQTARELAPALDRLHVVLFEHGPLEVALGDLSGVTTEVVVAGRLRELARFARVTRTLAARLTAGSFDRAVAWMPKAHLYLGPAAWAAGVPACWWQHGVPAPPSWLDRLASRVPARSVFSPSEVATAAQARLGGPPVRTVPLGVPDQRPDRDRAAALRRTWLGDGDVLALAVGRLQPSKGQHLILEAAKALAPRVPGLRWVIVGDAQNGDRAYRDDLVRQVEGEGLGCRVTFAGGTSDAATALSAADLLVHPSFGESFGLVVVEAMNLGLPVVATDCGGPRDLVDDGVTGRLVPVGDGAAIAEAVATLATDGALRARLGAAGRERQQRAFGLPAYLAAFTAALEAVGT